VADAVVGQRKEIVLLQRCKKRAEAGHMREGTGWDARPVRGQLVGFVESACQLM
jgi:hypothetical protein